MKRKAFTLVELLIVIVVIGILSAMMMFSSTEAVASAKATKIINDMRNIKTATIAWYLDNYERIVKNSDGTYWVKPDKGNLATIQDYLDKNNGKHYDEIKKYLSVSESNFILNEGKESEKRAAAGGYAIIDCGSANKRKEWYVVYCFGVGLSENSEGARIRKKLIGRAKTAGLLRENVPNSAFFDGKGNINNCVFMLALQLES